MKTFRLQDERGDTVAGIDGASIENPYVGSYGKLLPGQKPVAELEVDEFCRKEYSLSGGKPTVYVVVRVS
jgi:hypothetical protein